MEVSCKLHTQAAIPPGKRAPSIHLIGGWVGPLCQSTRGGEDKKCPCPCQKSNPSSLAHSLVTILSYAGSHIKGLLLKFCIHLLVRYLVK